MVEWGGKDRWIDGWKEGWMEGGRVEKREKATFVSLLEIRLT